MFNDPICAIATPYGVGAISIIRCSGENCHQLVNQIFKGKDLTKAKPNTINYGYIVDEGQAIDEVLISIFKAAPACGGGGISLRKMTEGAAFP